MAGLRIDYRRYLSYKLVGKSQSIWPKHLLIIQTESHYFVNLGMGGKACGYGLLIVCS